MQLTRVVIITNNTEMAASLSSGLIKRGNYLAVLEGPRMQRPDAENEVIRVLNMIALVKPGLVVFADMKQEEIQPIVEGLHPGTQHIHFAKDDDISKAENIQFSPAGLGRKDAATMLYETCIKQDIARDRTTLVVVENDGEVGSVIAANYALAHGADFISMEPPGESAVKSVGKKVASIEACDPSVKNILIQEMIDLVSSYLPANVSWYDYDKVMFVTDGIPYSVSLKGLKVTHMFRVNLGQAFVASIFSTHTIATRRSGWVGYFIAHKELDTKQEEAAFTKLLLRAMGIVRSTPNGKTRLIEYTMQTLPYDVLYIATHGRQIPGRRAQYDFMPSFGRETYRIETLESSSENGGVYSFGSVNGQKRKDKGWTVNHAKAWGEFLVAASKASALEKHLPPVTSENATLDMRELVLGGPDEKGLQSPIHFHRLASMQYPLVIVNACGSWTDIASRFMFSGAETYIGTLWPIRDNVAKAFGKKLLSQIIRRDLMDAFVLAKSQIHENTDRVNYIYTGAFETRFNKGETSGFNPNGIEALRNNIQSRLATLKRTKLPENAPEDIVKSKEVDEWFLEKELEDFNKLVDEIDKK